MDQTNEVWINPSNLILLNPLASNFTFINIIWCVNKEKKLQLFGNTRVGTNANIANSVIFLKNPIGTQK